MIKEISNKIFLLKDLITPPANTPSILNNFQVQDKNGDASAFSLNGNLLILDHNNSVKLQNVNLQQLRFNNFNPNFFNDEYQVNILGENGQSFNVQFYRDFTIIDSDGRMYQYGDFIGSLSIPVNVFQLSEGPDFNIDREFIGPFLLNTDVDKNYGLNQNIFDLQKSIDTQDKLTNIFTSNFNFFRQLLNSNDIAESTEENNFILINEPPTNPPGNNGPENNGPGSDGPGSNGPANTSPIVVNDSYTTNEDANLIVATANGIRANDIDVENDAVISLISSTSNGTLLFNLDGSFNYTPNANFFGQDTFSYQLTDNEFTSVIGLVTINVNAVNDAPLSFNNAYSTNEDNPLVVNVANGVLNNDSDIEGDPLIAQLITNVTNGSLILNNDGSFLYLPNLDFNGVDSFTYASFDGTVQGNIATVSITVNPVNDLPVVVDNAFTLNEDVVFVANLADSILNNDSDVDGDPLSSFLITDVTNGLLTLNFNGTFTYNPDPDFNGIDTFSYQANDGFGNSNIATVFLTVNPVNDLPVAFDDAYALNEDGFFIGNLADSILNNDSDIDGDPLSSILITDVTNGLLALNLDGTFTYIPDLDFNGIDAFSYVANDGFGNSNIATVTLTVNGVDDPPAISAPVAINTFEDTFTVIPGLSVSDPDGDLTDLKLDVISGFLSVILFGGATISAGANFSNDLTISGLQSDIINSLASLSYIGNANSNIGDILRVTATDATLLSDVELIPITLEPVNDAPSGSDNIISFNAFGNTYQNYNFVANDFGFSDPVEGDGFQSVVITTLPNSGILLFNALPVIAGDEIVAADIPNLQFKPDNSNSINLISTVFNYSIEPSFTFQVRDNGGVLNGGIDLDPTPNTIYLTTDPNIYLSNTNTTINYTENVNQFTFNLANNSDFTVNDIANGSIFDDIIAGDELDFSIEVIAQNTGVSGNTTRSLVKVELGDDTLNGNDGVDTIFGDNNSLTLNLSAFGHDAVFFYASANSQVTGGDDIINGGNDNDTLYGDWSIVTINSTVDNSGGGATFNVNAGESPDTFTTGGNDVINGGDGNDIIYGDINSIIVNVLQDAILQPSQFNNGQDTITGGAGNDMLYGDAINISADAMSVSAADLFVFAPGSGNDTIFDFNDALDLLDVSAYGFAGIGDVSVTVVGLNTVIDLDPLLNPGVDTITLDNFGGVITAADFVF